MYQKSKIFITTLFLIGILLPYPSYSWNEVAEYECENTCQDACANECEEPCDKRLGHDVYIGPELYYVNRTREGGTKQTGGVYGVRLGYERVKRYKIYWAVTGLYARGIIEGKSGVGTKIKSRFIDASIEGRLGYTLEQKCGWQCSFTPYVGYGYAIEENNFIHPSPLRLHFRTRFSYIPVGFLSRISPYPQFDVGLNFEAKFMFNASNKVTHDPEFGSNSMLIKERVHYRVELPLTYRYMTCIWFRIIPFYEYRTYGHQPNFPFDFLETKLQIYGGTLEILYAF